MNTDDPNFARKAIGHVLIIFACFMLGWKLAGGSNDPIPKSADPVMQYTTVTIGISQCEYIAARPVKNLNWSIVCHKGDCTNCHPRVNMVVPVN